MRTKYGACTSWLDPFHAGACAHCGAVRWRHADTRFDAVIEAYLGVLDRAWYWLRARLPV